MKTEEKYELPSPGHDVLLKYLNGTATSDECLSVDEWCGKDEKNERELMQLALLYDVRKTRHHMRNRDSYAAYKKVQRRIKGKTVRIMLQRVAVAASLIFGIFGIAILLTETRQESLITVHTGAGMRSETTLPDGTAVHLNANTKLVYPAAYRGKERWVVLSGEAYFDVIHDKSKSFTVKTEDEKINIRVLGTKFNVQAYSRDSLIQATLVEGSISVSLKGDNNSLLMKPMEQASFNTISNKITVRPVDPGINTAWLTGKFIFKDTPMSDALRQLSNYYSVDFDIKDDLIRDYSFTGIFENKPLSQILDYLEASSGINYEIVQPSGLTSEKKPMVILEKQ
ncbi:MAG: DUF4974 domain-containing protein [Bacteroidales bacterium]|nr:DUF4974 domain-containing protein [Bacteroidales bacterium]